MCEYKHRRPKIQPAGGKFNLLGAEEDFLRHLWALRFFPGLGFNRTRL